MDKQRLLAAMVGAGYTRETLSQKIGISRSTLTAKINGKRYFDTKEIDAMCEALGISNISERGMIFLSKTFQNRNDNSKH